MSPEDQAAEDRARDEAVEIINCLYPPDSEYEETRRIGIDDMLFALAVGWRALPVSVLEHMAQAQTWRDNHT